MTKETAQPAPPEKASIRAVRAFVEKHAPQQSPEDVELFINDLMRLIRVVIREAAYEVTRVFWEDAVKYTGSAYTGSAPTLAAAIHDAIAKVPK